MTCEVKLEQKGMVKLYKMSAKIVKEDASKVKSQLNLYERLAYLTRNKPKRVNQLLMLASNDFWAIFDRLLWKE